jgi:hypothetical protein
MSEVKVNKISPRTACGTVTLGDSGDTFTIPSGATITNAGTASGFGATGEISWDTTVKTTGTFTATSGVGYFLNTTGGTITVNLPAGAAGSSVAMADYAGTWQTNGVTVSPNGSEKMGGINSDVTLSTEGQSVTFVYIDGTQGWVNVLDSTSNVRGSAFIIATGGTISCCGDYKVHTFTGPGTFCVSNVGPGSPDQSDEASYVVVAGGGGGGYAFAGGGGAGGFREGKNSSDPYTASPLDATTALTLTATSYPITVGGGGGGAANPPGSPGGTPTNGCAGNNSVFSSITSAGGGYGGKNGPSVPGGAGGSGGGGGSFGGPVNPGGAGNTPPVSPAQGFAGGSGSAGPPDPGLQAGGGGGGATVVGTPKTPCGPARANGGTGATSSITGSAVARAGGGGGGSSSPPSLVGQSPCGSGGSGSSPAGCGADATDNKGGGGGGGGPGQSGRAGGSGVVIIRYKYQ